MTSFLTVHSQEMQCWQKSWPFDWLPTQNKKRRAFESSTLNLCSFNHEMILRAQINQIGWSRFSMWCHWDFFFCFQVDPANIEGLKSRLEQKDKEICALKQAAKVRTQLFLWFFVLLQKCLDKSVRISINEKHLKSSFELKLRLVDYFVKFSIALQFWTCRFFANLL